MWGQPPRLSTERSSVFTGLNIKIGGVGVFDI